MTASCLSLAALVVKLSGMCPVCTDALEQEIAAFGNSKPYRTRTYDDVESGEYIVEVDITAPDIWPIGAILGDFLNCLRSSLDHLVYGLSHLHGTPSKKPSFPIVYIFNDNTFATIAECTRGVPAEAVKIIESLQPYHAPGAYKSTHLYRLNELWNMDKHRHIPLDSGGSELIFPNAKNLRSKTIENDHLVMRYSLISKPDVNLDPVLVIPILNFGERAQGVVIQYRDLVEMYEFVSEKVIPRFQRFYEKPIVTG